MEEEKARLRAIDARPVKKIAEAKARKKMKLHKRLDQARQKANVRHKPCSARPGLARVPFSNLIT